MLARFDRLVAVEDEVRTKLQQRATRVVHRVRIRVETGPDAGTECAPDDVSTLTVGTSPDNTLVLTDPTVSRYHLELRHTPAGVAVEDLGSRNGTFAGQLRVERAVLPLYRDDPDGWAAVMRSSIALNGSYFTTQRMIRDYVHRAYLD